MGPRDRRRAGVTLAEMLVVLALMALLGTLGFSRLELNGLGLTAVEGELRGCLEQAMLRAQARGIPVRAAPQAPAGQVPSGGLPLILPRGVRWGLPPGGVSSWPPRMRAPVRAQGTGYSHPVTTVTPWGTAMASVWLLTDGRDALCLRLNDEGRLQMYRWRHRARQWARV